METNAEIKSRKQPHYSACDDCHKQRGGQAGDHNVTASIGTCPYCKKENTSLIPWIDYNWPEDKDSDTVAKIWRD